MPNETSRLTMQSSLAEHGVEFRMIQGEKIRNPLRALLRQVTDVQIALGFVHVEVDVVWSGP